eukprot:TRINITY_DN2355_c0_g2_i1.p1 TRINITY_DN2355_c0_g2~~TRINITY_DN2355_c0_g2_i1.p1  ORF type:complete len:122 (+),score=4.63 TRINITY_DN2355_c0_g2_i1:63-428(+)
MHTVSYACIVLLAGFQFQQALARVTTFSLERRHVLFFTAILMISPYQSSSQFNVLCQHQKTILTSQTPVVKRSNKFSLDKDNIFLLSIISNTLVSKSAAALRAQRSRSQIQPIASSMLSYR